MAKTERRRTTTTKSKSLGRGDKPLDGSRARSLEPRRRAAPDTKPDAKPDEAPGQLTDDVARAVQAALDKKALDVIVLDLRQTPAFTDFFLLCSGQNTRQVHAIADAVEEALRGIKIRPAHVEGYKRGEWVLMDFFSFIVHIFTPQTRDFYSLERLWGDAQRIEISDDPPGQLKTAD